jgi:hypothetical protein
MIPTGRVFAILCNIAMSTSAQGFPEFADISLSL